jgi:hypothetical protein
VTVELCITASRWRVMLNNLHSLSCNAETLSLYLSDANSACRALLRTLCAHLALMIVVDCPVTGMLTPAPRVADPLKVAVMYQLLWRDDNAGLAHGRTVPRLRLDVVRQRR